MLCLSLRENVLFYILICCNLPLFFPATWCYPKKLLLHSPHTVLHQHLPKILQILNKFKTCSVCSKYREEGEWTSWVLFVLLIWHSLSVISSTSQAKCDKCVVMPLCDRLPNVLVEILQWKIKLWNFSLFSSALN